VNDRSPGDVDGGSPHPPAGPIGGDRRPIVVLRLVPAAYGRDLVVPGRHPQCEYLGAVVQRQNSVQTKRAKLLPVKIRR